MKRFLLLIGAAALVWAAAFAQPGAAMPEQVAAMRRGTIAVAFGGPTRAEGRSYNNAPTFFVYIFTNHCSER